MINAETRTGIVTLRLLIARAAQKDSLQWWEDESLTQAGGFLVDRLFIMDAPEIARKLAIEAAATRYDMSFGDDKSKLHLFRLDQTGHVELDLQFTRFLNFDMPAEPIPTLDALREKLDALTPKRMPYTVASNGLDNQLEIRIKGYSRKTPVLDLAQTLAWAALESPYGKPLFPYIQL